MQTAIVTLQQQVNASLLQAVKIANPNSQEHALNAINAVGTVVSAMLALLQSVSNKAALARMAAKSPIKTAMVEQYLNKSQAAKMVALHYNESPRQASLQVEQVEAAEIEAGL